MDPKFFLIFINLYLTFATQKVPRPKFPVDPISKATPEKRQDNLTSLKRNLLSRKRKHLQLSSIGGRVEVMQERHQSYKRQSTAEETEYLTVHNQKRASVSPPAANMLTMKWSTELTQVASAYAARCIWAHNSQRTAQQSTFSYVGENLYVTSAATASPTAAITSWDNEKNFYNFEQNTCSGVCGHYTQLVWHNSEYLGCASHTCATFEGLDDRFNGGTIVVCNYGPGGNINTATNRPYTAVSTPCDNNMCANGATCVTDASSLGYRCDCAAGFTGALCDTALSPCDNNQCTNGATCVASVSSSGYRCECPSGFTGDFCETAVSPCDGNRCANGATCAADASSLGYRCDCAAGFTGALCDTALSPCDNNQCTNGATCVASVSSSGYRCECPSGFTGDFCETAVSPCDGNMCANGATCAADASSLGYRCDCAAGFTGALCDTALSPCDNNQCTNGATCVASVSSSGYRCECPSGFTGDFCETAVSPCDGNRCANGATCAADASSLGYRCDCAAGFTGALCDTALSPCDNNQCTNGATCVSEPTTSTLGYRCQCPSGFTGDFCETPVSPCDGHMCANGATCVPVASTTTGYRCDCLPNFTGSLCETSIPGPLGQSLTCSFEDVIECPHLQNSNGDSTDWIVREGPTPSRSTGPSRAYGGRKYIYFEATGLRRRSFAYLTTPILPESEYCVNFAYNMYGSGMGALYAYVKNDNIDDTLVWYAYGNHGSSWKTESVYIPSGPNTFFYFVAVRGRTFRSDIALDDVSFIPGACTVTLPTDFDADD